jgi:hypothetical protein
VRYRRDVSSGTRLTEPGRILRNALELHGLGVRADDLVGSALSRAGLERVPRDGAALWDLVDPHLLDVVREAEGASAAERLHGTLSSAVALLLRLEMEAEARTRDAR